MQSETPLPYPAINGQRQRVAWSRDNSTCKSCLLHAAWVSPPCAAVMSSLRLWPPLQQRCPSTRQENPNGKTKGKPEGYCYCVQPGKTRGLGPLMNASRTQPGQHMLCVGQWRHTIGLLALHAPFAATSQGTSVLYRAFLSTH